MASVGGLTKKRLDGIFRRLALAGLAWLILLLGALPTLAAGAEPTRLAEAQLALWPEYDDPSLLVIVAGRLPEGTPMPATIRFLVPAGARLYAAAYQGEQGDLVYATSQNTKPSTTAGWDELSYEVESPLFQLEYYQNDAIKGGPDKVISYDYRFFYPVDDLTVEVQQPLRATNFVTKPETQSVLTGEKGIRYYQLRFGNTEAAKPLPLEISYTKADNEPSVIPQAQQAPPPTATAETDANWTVLGILGGGFAVVVVFLWVVVRRRVSLEPYAAPVRRSATAAPTPTAAQQRRGASGAVRPEERRFAFCPSCGGPLGANVNFCPRCGERVA